MLTFSKLSKRLGVKQKLYRRKDDFEILKRPFVTFNDLLCHTKNSILLVFIDFFFIKIGS